MWPAGRALPRHRLSRLYAWRTDPRWFQRDEDELELPAVPAVPARVIDSLVARFPNTSPVLPDVHAATRDQLLAHTARVQGQWDVIEALIESTAAATPS